MSLIITKKALQISRAQIARTLTVAIVGSMMSFMVAPAANAVPAGGTLIAASAGDSPALIGDSGNYSLSTSRNYETFTIISSGNDMALDGFSVNTSANSFSPISDLDLTYNPGEETITGVVSFFDVGVATLTISANNLSGEAFDPISITYTSSRTATEIVGESLTVTSLSDSGSELSISDTGETYTIRTTRSSESFKIQSSDGKLDAATKGLNFYTDGNSPFPIDLSVIGDDSFTTTVNLVDYYPVRLDFEAYQTSAEGRGHYSPITIFVIKVASLELPETTTVVFENVIDDFDAVREVDITELNTDSETVITMSSSYGTVSLDDFSGVHGLVPSVLSLNPETATVEHDAGTNMVRIKGIDAGTTVIEIAYDGMESATVTVTVSRLIQSPLALTVDSATVGVTQTTATQVTGGEGDGAVTYGSSNAGICTVDPTTGVVTGVGSGTCVITVSKAAGATGGIKFLAATATVNVIVDATAPVVSTRGTSSSGTQITITYGEALKSVTPLVDAFTVLVGGEVETVTAVLVSGSTVVLTLTNTVINGDVVTLAYTQGSGTEIQDIVGIFAADFTATSVTNNVPSPTPPSSAPTIDYAAIAAANEAKVAADKLAAEKVIADKLAADKVAEDKVIADAKVAADKVIADAIAAEEAKVIVDAKAKADVEAAAVVAAIRKVAATNAVQINNSSKKSTKLNLDLADKYFGAFIIVEVRTKTKAGFRTKRLKSFIVETEDGKVSISTRKLLKGQTLIVRAGKKVLFRQGI